MDEAASQPAGRPPLELLTEDELVRRARAAAARAIAAGRGTLAWSVQWAVYDDVTAELGRRALAWAASAAPEALADLRAWRAGLGPGER